MRGADPSIVRPVVVANGVPKAGTHLLGVAALRPLAMDLGRFVSDYGSSRRVERQSDEVLLRSLRSARGGSLSVRILVERLPCRLDPGRVGGDPSCANHPSTQEQSLFLNATTFGSSILITERTRACSEVAGGCASCDNSGLDQGFEQAPLADRLQRFSEWLNCDGEVVQVVRFEDLIGMSVGERSNVLAGIARPRSPIWGSSSASGTHLSPRQSRRVARRVD